MPCRPVQWTAAGCTAVFNYTNQGITDVITHITELNYCYSGGCFIAGSPFWDKLSDEDKAIFAECAQLASDEFYHLLPGKDGVHDSGGPGKRSMDRGSAF